MEGHQGGEYDCTLYAMVCYTPEQVDTDEKMDEKSRSRLRQEMRMTVDNHGRRIYVERSPHTRRGESYAQGEGNVKHYIDTTSTTAFSREEKVGRE